MTKSKSKSDRVKERTKEYHALLDKKYPTTYDWEITLKDFTKVANFYPDGILPSYYIDTPYWVSIVRTWDEDVLLQVQTDSYNDALSIVWELLASPTDFSQRLPSMGFR